MWTIFLQRPTFGEGGETGERQGQFALSKHPRLLLSSDASHQSRPGALAGDSRKDAPRSEAGWIVYRATQSIGKDRSQAPGAELVDFLRKSHKKKGVLALASIQGITGFSEDDAS